MTSKQLRGLETKEKLIFVGTELFGKYGFAGVSMRQLAQAADVNLAAISYHFGSKAGLYEALIDMMIERREELMPSVADIDRRVADVGKDPEKMSNLIMWYMDVVVRAMIGNPRHFSISHMISRELAHPSEFFSKLAKGFFNPFMDTTEKIIYLVLGQDVDREEAVIVSHMMMGACIKFLDGHQLVLARLGWDEYDQDNVSKIAKILGHRSIMMLGLKPCEQYLDAEK